MATREDRQFRPSLEVLEDRSLPSGFPFPTPISGVQFHLFRPLLFRTIPPQERPQQVAPVFRSQNVTFTTGGIAATGSSATVHPNFQIREVGFNGVVRPQAPAPAPNPFVAGFDSIFITFGIGRPFPFG